MSLQQLFVCLWKVLGVNALLQMPYVISHSFEFTWEEGSHLGLKVTKSLYKPSHVENECLLGGQEET